MSIEYGRGAYEHSKTPEKKEKPAHWVEHPPMPKRDRKEDSENQRGLFSLTEIPDSELSVQNREIERVPPFMELAGHLFEIRSVPIGKGSFGSVYEASLVKPSEDEFDLERPQVGSIVLKFIIEGTSNLSSEEAIRKEARAWSDHGGLVDARRFELEDGTNVSVIALERAPGKSLLELKKSGAFDRPSPRISLELMLAFRSYLKQLLSLKKRGWTSHNDIKPANLMLATGQVIARIIDLGLAHEEQEDERLKTHGSDNGAIIGTAPYISPEVWNGNFDETADVRALALSLARVLGTMDLDDFSPHKVVAGTAINTPKLTDDSYGERLRKQFPEHMTFSSECDFSKLLYELVLPHANASTYAQTRRANPVTIEGVLSDQNDILRDHIAYLAADAAQDWFAAHPPGEGSQDQDLERLLSKALGDDDIDALRELRKHPRLKAIRKISQTGSPPGI